MLDELTRKTDGKFQQYLEKFDKVIASGQTLKEVSSIFAEQLEKEYTLACRRLNIPVLI